MANVSNGASDKAAGQLGIASKALLVVGILFCAAWVAVIVRANLGPGLIDLGAEYGESGPLMLFGAWLRYHGGFVLVLGVCAVLEGIFGLLACRGSKGAVLAWSVVGVVVSLGMLVLFALTVGLEPVVFLTLVPAALSVWMFVLAKAE